MKSEDCFPHAFSVVDSRIGVLGQFNIIWPGFSIVRIFLYHQLMNQRIDNLMQSTIEKGNDSKKSLKMNLFMCIFLKNKKWLFGNHGLYSEMKFWS